MANYYIGTAGWSYKDWEGIVYPKRKPRAFHALIFLARFIDMVEINSTFYRPPSMQIAVSWIKRIAEYPDFLFTLKLHQVFTHGKRNYAQTDIDTFKMGIDPLHAANRLAAILIQFPWSFIRTAFHIDYLARLFKAFQDFPLALEVRHDSWDTKEFYSLLSEHNVAFCNIDQPIFRNSLLPMSRTTHSEFSYVRLHGRNSRNWFRKDAGRDERYDYLYSKDELSEWINRIKELGGKSDKVFVITNNHYQGQALANAVQIKNMISGEKMEIPLSLVERYPALKDILKKIREGQMGLFDNKENKDIPSSS